jgi:hypothetical protein
MTKTNNTNLALKLELRRTVLKAAGFKKLRVLDLFAGGGEIWMPLRQEFKIESYMPCDVKPQMPGTLKANVTPLFIEAIAGAKINVVDVDGSGEPWEIWGAVARRITRPAAVFLGMKIHASLSDFARAAMGIPQAWILPPSPELGRLAARFFIRPEFQGIKIASAWQIHLGAATNYGLLVHPADASP